MGSVDFFQREQYCLSGEEHFEAYIEMFGAENVEWTSRDTLSSADRLRIQDWAYPPTDELYLNLNYSRLCCESD